MSGESFGKIAVLCGGPSCEREISLISGKAVADAFKGLGYSVMTLDPENGFENLLKKENISIAFLALHGTFGEDGTIQTILEKEGIPYTGSGPKASREAFDKATSQRLFLKAGIRVPEFEVLKSGQTPKTRIPFPCVVKPASAGSSVGISLVASADGLAKACLEAFVFSEELLIERYIPGRELTVGVLGEEALPIVEIIANRTFYDYEAKYKDNQTRYEFPAKLANSQAGAVTTAALAAYRALGCEVMARVDVILDNTDKPFVLEANTIPGLTGKSLLPKAASAAGIDFPALCVRILQLSWARFGLKRPRPVTLETNSG